MRAMLAAAASAIVVSMIASSSCVGGAPELPATLSSIHDDVFHVSCSASVCHGGAGPADGMNLDVDPFKSIVNVDSFDNPGEKRVVPGDSEHSVLYLVLLGPHGATQRMPQVGDPLPPDEIDRIKRWIDAGAQNN